MIAGTERSFINYGGEDTNAGVPASVVINEGQQNIDFRVESDNYSHMICVDASADKMIIGTSDALPATSSLVEIYNDNNDEALTITHSVQGGAALDITGNMQEGNFINVTANSLTTGGMLNLTSNSNNTSNRTLVTVKNDNTNATGVQMVHFINDAIGGAGDPILLVESTAAETEALIELRNSNAATDKPPILKFNRSDTSADADGMDIGSIIFAGPDHADNDTTYASILAEARETQNGSETGQILFKALTDGDERTFLSIVGNSGAYGELVVNDGSSAAVDFRVESNGEDEAIFLDSAQNKLYFNKGETAFTTHIHNTNDVAMSVTSAGVVFNEDGHATNDLRVESDNNTHMLFVDAGAETVQVCASTAGVSPGVDGFSVVNDFHDSTYENKIPSGKHGSGEVLRYSPGADDTLTGGRLYFLHTDGTWDETDADAVATGATQMLGIAIGGSARTVGCLIKGFYHVPASEILNLPGSGACDGLPLYVSTTAGHLDFTAPSGNNDFVRIVGYAIDDDSSDVLIYFDPDKTHVEITA